MTVKQASRCMPLMFGPAVPAVLAPHHHFHGAALVAVLAFSSLPPSWSHRLPSVSVARLSRVGHTGYRLRKRALPGSAGRLAEHWRAVVECRDV